MTHLQSPSSTFTGACLPVQRREMPHPQGQPVAFEPSTFESPADGSAFEYLADLFLSEPSGVAGPDVPGVVGKPSTAEPKPPRVQRSGQGHPHGAKRRIIEGVIVGHLPVMASPWATQYARHVTLTEGTPTAMLRVREGTIQIDMIDGEPPARTPNSIEEAASAVSASCGHWLVRVDEALERTLASDARLDRLTLLTGADEAAVIACYRTLKLLSQHMPLEHLKARVRVAILGSPHNKAAEAAQRLRSAVGAFLGMPLPVELCAGKIGGAPALTVYREEVPGSPDEVIEKGLRAMVMASSNPSSSTLISPAPSCPAPSMSMARIQQSPAPMTPSTDRSNPIEAEAIARGVVAQLAADGLSHESRVSHELGRAQPAHLLALALAKTQPGLVPLRATCPVVTRAVELAADDHGRLHLLAEARASWEIDAALSSLLAVQAWASLHLPLLSLTPAADGRMRPLTPGLAPVMHLMVPTGMDVRRLLDGHVRVHMLVPVEGLADAVCVGLN
jgi:hypothetical protein